MIKCEKCLYRKNCQFLATHKNTIVEGCTAFESENDLRIEAVKEFWDKLKTHSRKMQSSDFSGEFWDRAVLVEDGDNIVKEMEGEG